MPQHADFIKHGDLPFSAQLTAFKLAIGAYAALLKIPAASITAQAADADYFAWVLQCQAAMRQGAQQWTSWKDAMRDGSAAPEAAAPVEPVFPVNVPAVPPGIEARFRELVAQIRAAIAYTQAIGEALGIVGPQETGPDLATVQPNIDAHISGNRVEVKWGWQGMSAFLDLCELQVDRGTGTFVPLAYDTTPGYVDTAPFPAVPVKWTYRAIYRVGDNQVGVWSKTVSVMVG